MKKSKMSEPARQARNEYMRDWRAKHKDNIKLINHRYWEKKAINKRNEAGDFYANDEYHSSDCMQK